MLSVKKYKQAHIRVLGIEKEADLIKHINSLDILQTYEMRRIIQVSQRSAYQNALETLTRKFHIPQSLKEDIIRWSIGGNFNDLTKCLLDHGYDTKVGYTGFSPLSYACFLGNLEAATMLVKYGFDIEQTTKETSPFQDACYHGYPDIAEMLMKNGCVVNKLRSSGSEHIYHRLTTEEKSLMRDSFKDGQTNAIGLACSGGHTKVVELLLKNNCCDFSLSSNMGIDILTLALVKKYDEITLLLLKKYDYNLYLEVKSLPLLKTLRDLIIWYNRNLIPKINEINVEKMLVILSGTKEENNVWYEFPNDMVRTIFDFSRLRIYRKE